MFIYMHRVTLFLYEKLTHQTFTLVPHRNVENDPDIAISVPNLTCHDKQSQYRHVYTMYIYGYTYMYNVHSHVHVHVPNRDITM